MYERSVLEPMRQFVDATNDGLARAKIPIYGTSQQSIFRIYRDIRFANDKRPFRTYAAAYLSRNARRGTFGGLYLRIGPEREESFLSVTFYLLGAPELRVWRRTIVEDPRSYAKMLAALKRRGLTLQDAADDDALVRMPRGFEAYRDDPLADHLRRRSFSIHRPLGSSEIESPALVETAVRFVRDARPLLRYGWDILARVPVPPPSKPPRTSGVNAFADWVSARK